MVSLQSTFFWTAEFIFLIRSSQCLLSTSKILAWDANDVRNWLGSHLHRLTGEHGLSPPEKLHAWVWSMLRSLWRVAGWLRSHGFPYDVPIPQGLCWVWKAECGLATGRTKLLGVVLVSRAQFLALFLLYFLFHTHHLPFYYLAVKASWKLSQSWCHAWPCRAVSQSKPGFFSDYPDTGIAILTQTTTSTSSTMRRETD